MSAPQRDYERTVFVGNLNYKTDSKTLAEALAEFGKVTEARVITARIRGAIQSRGFGFVKFETKEDVAKATAAATKEVDGRKIRIVQSKQTPRKPRVTAFLGGIVENTTEEQIKTVFATAKTVNIHPPKDGRRGFAFVTFESEDALKAAIKDVREIALNEAKVIVRFAKPKIQFRRNFRRRGGYRRAPKSGEQQPKQE